MHTLTNSQCLHNNKLQFVLKVFQQLNSFYCSDKKHTKIVLQKYHLELWNQKRFSEAQVDLWEQLRINRPQQQFSYWPETMDKQKFIWALLDGDYSNNQKTWLFAWKRAIQNLQQPIKHWYCSKLKESNRQLTLTRFSHPNFGLIPRHFPISCQIS